MKSSVQFRLDWSRGRLLVAARPHPKFRPTASPEPQHAADVRHANQVGALLPAPIRSHQLSPASESRPTTALPLAPSPRPAQQGSEAVLGHEPHFVRTTTRPPPERLPVALHKTCTNLCTRPSIPSPRNQSPATKKGPSRPHGSFG
jgi:hypothetical protein